MQIEGLSSVFSGIAVFRNDATGKYYLGVWGARKASQFRSRLRKAGFQTEIIEAAPPGRLAWHQSTFKSKHSLVKAPPASDL